MTLQQGQCSGQQEAAVAGELLRCSVPGAGRSPAVGWPSHLGLPNSAMPGDREGCAPAPLAQPWWPLQSSGDTPRGKPIARGALQPPTKRAGSAKGWS